MGNLKYGGSIYMQFIDLSAQYDVLKSEINSGIQKVLDHGQYIMGPEVKELENELSGYVGVKHCLTCANGTDALQLLFMANDIGVNDAVFTTNLTMIATIEPACMLGAVPVFCDIDNDSYNICIDSLERQIKAVLKEGKYLPKAVIAVDIFGNPCDYDALDAICKKYNLLLIEDAAQSFGSSYKGKLCGSFGQSAITSFFPAKPLGCYGDGGAIFTNDDSIAELCESLRVHGKGPDGKYANIRVGVNSRLDTLQAALLLAKLNAFPNELECRQVIAARYNDAFSGIFKTPTISDGSVSAYAQYVLLANNEVKRNTIIDKLNSNNIPNMIYYPMPLHNIPIFKSTNHYDETFPISTDYCSRTFSIPFHPYLTESDQDKIIKAVLG